MGLVFSQHGSSTICLIRIPSKTFPLTGLIDGKVGSILGQRARRVECAAQKSPLRREPTSYLIRSILNRRR